MSAGGLGEQQRQPHQKEELGARKGERTPIAGAAPRDGEPKQPRHPPAGDGGGGYEVVDVADGHCCGGGSASNEPLSLCTRAQYGLYTAFCFALALILRGGFSFLHAIPAFSDWCDSGDRDCLGHAAVYRVCFALFLFHLLHYCAAWAACGLPCIKSACFCVAGCVPCKLFAFAVLLVVSFFVPSPFFLVFAWACVFLAAGFIVMQAVILIHAVYELNDRLTGSDDDADRKKLACAATVMYAACAALVGMMYYWFVPSPSCHGNNALVSVTLGLAVLYTALSVCAPHGSVLCAGGVFVYCAIETFAAIQSGSTDGACNRIYHDKTEISPQMILSCAIALAVLVYVSLSTASSRDAFSRGDRASFGAAAAGPSGAVQSYYRFFFLAMCLAATYMAMVLTGWRVDKGDSGDGRGDIAVDSSAAAMWARIVSSWLAALLYMWTLAAPLVCGARDFA